MPRFSVTGVMVASAVLILSACSGGDGNPEVDKDTGGSSSTSPAAAGSAASEVAVSAPVAPPVNAASGATLTLAGLTGDAARGQRVFMQCKSCHEVAPGVNKIGPSLAGIVGRRAGTIPNFRYSNAQKNSGIIWTEDTLFEYLANPRGYIPGTYMSFVGLRDAQQRADVIAYLKAQP